MPLLVCERANEAQMVVALSQHSCQSSFKNESGSCFSFIKSPPLTLFKMYYRLKCKHVKVLEENRKRFVLLDLGMLSLYDNKITW